MTGLGTEIVRRDEIRLVFEDAYSYDYLIVNDEIDGAVSDLRHVVGASRVRRQPVVDSQRRRFGFD